MLITPKLTKLARRNHGLLTVDAWTDAGHSASSFYDAIEATLLVKVAPNVAALAGRVIGPAERIAAGVLSFGPNVKASHRSGAWLWGADLIGDRPVDLLSTDRARRTDIAGYIVHWTRDRDELGSKKRRGIPCCTPYRVLLDLGSVVPRTVVLRTAEEFLVAGHIKVRETQAYVERHRRRGREGVGALEWALGELSDGVAVPASRLEAVAARVFRQADIDGWEFQPSIEGYRVDFAFRAERLIVEVDGWRHHGAVKRVWDRDAERDLFLTSQGWLVVRLTWAMLTRQPTKATTRLRAALDLRSGVAQSARAD